MRKAKQSEENFHKFLTTPIHLISVPVYSALPLFTITNPLHSLRLTHFHLSVGFHTPWGPYNSPFSPVLANLFLLFSPSGYKHLFFSVKKRTLSLKFNSDYLWVVRMLLICIFFTFWNFSYCQIFYNDYIICIIRKTQMS